MGDGQCWFVVIGSGTTENRSAAGLLYRSKSDTDVLSKWSFVSVVIQENSAAAYEQYQYSCPDFFELNGSWVWMSLNTAWSNGAMATSNIYYVGSLSDEQHKFHPSQATPFVQPSSRFGHTISKSGADDSGRRIMWGAICGLPESGIPNPKSKIPNASTVHGGCTMSLGQELSLGSGGGGGASDGQPLRFRFIQELSVLRQEPKRQYNHVHAGLFPSAPVVEGGLLVEIEAAFVAQPTSSAALIGLDLFGENGGVRIAYNRTAGELFFSGNCTRGADGTDKKVAVPLQLHAQEQLALHIYIDGSVVEVIANERAPIAVIITPPADADTRVVVVGDTFTVAESLAIWNLTPAVPF